VIVSVHIDGNGRGEGWEFRSISYLGDTPGGGPMVIVVWSRRVDAAKEGAPESTAL